MNILFQKTHERAFGTFPLKGDDLRAAIALAAEAGYRAFDTAQMYQNEADTGRALAETGLARDALCVTTKVGVDNFTTPRFLPSVRASLDDLRMAHVDLLLLHWPAPDGDSRLALDLLQEAQALGLATHIGLSNFTAAMMRDARAHVQAPLVVNQVEFHPLLDQSKLLTAASETGIPLSSYCSVARGEVFKYPLFTEIAAAYGKTPAQIVLRWILQKGLPITTMSTKAENIRANFDVMDFILSSTDMARIEALTAIGFRVVGRDKVPYAPVFD